MKLAYLLLFFSQAIAFALLAFVILQAPPSPDVRDRGATFPSSHLDTAGDAR